MVPLQQNLSDLLTTVVRALVDAPDQVEVLSRVSQDEVHLTVVVAKEDRGKVIGKEGKTMTALRVLFGRVAAASRSKVYIQMADVRGSRD